MHATLFKYHCFFSSKKKKKKMQCQVSIQLRFHLFKNRIEIYHLLWENITLFFFFFNLSHMRKMWEIYWYSFSGVLGLSTCIELVRVKQQIVNRPMYYKGDGQRESLLYRFLGFANYREYLNILLKKKWNSAPQFEFRKFLYYLLYVHQHFLLGLDIEGVKLSKPCIGSPPKKEEEEK